MLCVCYVLSLLLLLVYFDLLQCPAGSGAIGIGFTLCPTDSSLSTSALVCQPLLPDAELAMLVGTQPPISAGHDGQCKHTHTHTRQTRFNSTHNYRGSIRMFVCFCCCGFHFFLLHIIYCFSFICFVVVVFFLCFPLFQAALSLSVPSLISLLFLPILVLIL